MKQSGIWLVVAGFVVLASIFGSTRLDIDEFRVVKEPYEMLGGDYTVGYLKAGEWPKALDCAARAYRFHWHYRPMFAPVIAEHDRRLFEAEEKRFGYARPDDAEHKSLETYAKRLIVPEPDRFYRNGAGVSLFSAVLRLPSLAILKALSGAGFDLLDLQFHARYHWLFLVARLHGLIAGVLCLLLVHRILREEAPPGPALPGAVLFAALPPALMFFPNLHYDALLAPLVLLSAAWFVRGRHLAGGLVFGLALAAKNAAVFVLPAAVAFVAYEAWQAYRASGWPAAGERLRRRLAGLAVFGLAAIVTLSPFANPVSEAREILTPIVARPFDPRGENVASFNLFSAANPAARAAGEIGERPAITKLKWLVGYNLSLLLLLLGLPLVWSRVSRPLNRFGFFMLLTMFPYGLVFGNGLGYRSLMFLPFFALIGGEVLGRRALLTIVGFLVAIDLVFLADPMGSSGMRYAPLAAPSPPAPSATP